MDLGSEYLHGLETARAMRHRSWMLGCSMVLGGLVSALALGPQQRVVTVEVGPQNARVWLVLGVTQQSIQCLHTMAADGAAAPSLVPQENP